MNLLNREQLTSLWLGIITVVVMGLMPPWREAAGNGNPLAYAPLSQPPVALTQNGVTIDYARLSVEWIITIFITGGLLATFHKVAAAGGAVAADKREVSNSAASSGATQPGSSVQGQQAGKSSGIVENSSREAGVASGRKLSFPRESLGDLLVESSDDDDYWEFFSKASGTVAVPAGKRLQLELVKDAQPKFAHLKTLPPDAIYSLDLSGSRVSDSDLENLSHLTGIRELDLSDTSVSDLGIKSLSSLPNLQKIWLDNTRVTDKGLSELSNLRELSKISLVGTDLNVIDAQLVVKSFPQQCELVLEENG